MSHSDHYLKQELYSRVGSDSAIFDFLQAGSLDGIGYWDLEHPQEQWMSRRLKELFGYLDHEVPNTSDWWQKNVFPEDLPAVLDAFHKHCADPNHPCDQTARFRHKNGSTVWVRCRGIAIRDATGKSIRMLGAITDITAIKRTEDRLRSIYDAVSDLYFTADLETGVISECNQALAEMTGFAEMIGTSFWELCDPQSKSAAEAVSGTLQKESEIRDVELKLRQKNGISRSILLSAHCETDPQTKRVVFRAWGRDIGHLKRFANFEVLTSALPGAILLLDGKGSVLSANPAAEQILGRRKEELSGKLLRSLLGSGGTGAGLFELQPASDSSGVRADGSVIPLHVEVGTLELEEGAFRIVSLSDVTRRNLVEKALRDSEDRFRQLTEGLPQLVWTATPEGRCDYLSPQWVAYTGIAEKQQLDGGWLEQVHPADRTALGVAWSLAVANGAPFQFDFRIRRRDGEYRWFDTRAIPLRNAEGKIVKWFGSNTDVQRSREMSAALIREQQKLANLVTLAPAVFCSFRARLEGSFCFPYSSPSIVDLCGIEPEVLRRNAEPLFAMIHPDDLFLVEESIRLSAESMEPCCVQFRLRHATKGELWVESSSTPALDQSGAVVWHGFLADITERKLGEADQHFLVQLGAKLQTASGPEAITKIGSQTLVDYFKVARCSVSAIDVPGNTATLLHKNVRGVPAPSGVVYPLSRWMNEPIIRVLAAGNSLAISNTISNPLTADFYEQTYKPLDTGAIVVIPLRREGQWVSAVSLSVPEPRVWSEREINLARTAADRIWSAFEAARALANERATNVSLAASEERLRLALQSGAIGIWEQNFITGNIHWDERAKAIFELPPDLPVTVELVLSRIHPEDRDEVREVSEHITDPLRGEHFQLTYRVEVSRGNGICYVHSQGQTFFEGEGPQRHAIRAVGTLQDITERKISQAKLERSLNEKQTLLQEVHHRVKNNLQIISSLLSMQASSMEDQSAAAKLIDSERRVKSMAMIHELLYHQKDMSSIDLAEYLRDMTAHLASSVASSEITFRLEVSPVAIPIDQAIPCGLLLNELVTNALKYAYPSGAGEILIKLSSTDNSVSITVSDSGVGLPGGFKQKASQSLGMTIIEVLTQQLDGELEIIGSPGATFTVRFPTVAGGRNMDERPTPRTPVQEMQTVIS